MALFKPAFGDIIGSVGGVTFQRSASGAVIKSKGRSKQVSSPLQTLRQSFMRYAQNVWSNVLSVPERSSWSTLASRTPFRNAFGDKYYLSGQQLFLKSANNLNLAGESYTAVAPSSFGVSDLVSLSLTVESGEPDILPVSFSPALGSNEILLVNYAPNVSPAVENVKSLMSYCGYADSAFPSPVDIPIPNAPLTPVVGTRWWIRGSVLNVLSGARSSGILTSTVVVSTP